MHRLARLGSLMALSGVTLFTGACAGLGVRTEGTSGPIAWRVIDVAVVTRDIRGQAVDGQAFTVVVTNTSDRTLTFTRMDEKRYRPGTNTGFASYTGRWVLRPGLEWKINRFTSLVCNDAGGCAESGSTQSLLQIILTGSDDENRPVEARLDITLPPAAIGRAPVVR
jgi:hypothetical protein